MSGGYITYQDTLTRHNSSPSQADSLTRSIFKEINEMKSVEMLNVFRLTEETTHKNVLSYRITILSIDLGTNQKLPATRFLLSIKNKRNLSYFNASAFEAFTDEQHWMPFEKQSVQLYDSQNATMWYSMTDVLVKSFIKSIRGGLKLKELPKPTKQG